MWIDPRLFSGHASVLLVTVAISSASATASPRAFWTALAWGVAASLTYIHGSLVWPALFVGLWVTGHRGRVAWPVALAVTLALEVTRTLDVWRLTPAGPAAPLPAAGFADMVYVALGVLGAPVAYGRTDVTAIWAVVAGAVGTAVVMAACLRAAREPEYRRRALPWLMLAAWALTNVAAMALGRARLGIGVVFTERYVPVTAMFWGALVALVALSGRGADAGRGALRRVLLVGSGVALALAWGAASWDAIAGTRLTALASRLGVGRACLAAWPDVDDECLTLLFPDASRARTILAHVASRDPSFARPGGRRPMTTHLRRVPPSLAWSKVHVESALPGGTLIDAQDVDGEAWGPLVLQHPPSSLFWDLHVPDAPQAWLETGVRVNSPPWPERGRGDGVLFEVRVEASGTATPWRRVVPPAADGTGFTPVKVDLAPWRGRAVRVWLVTAAGDSPGATNAFDWAVWLYPSLGPSLR
jgi:hypothetical protein